MLLSNITARNCWRRTAFPCPCGRVRARGRRRLRWPSCPPALSWSKRRSPAAAAARPAQCKAAASREEAARIVASLGTAVDGKPIHGFRIEQHVDHAHEAYVSLSVDAAVGAHPAHGRGRRRSRRGSPGCAGPRAFGVGRPGETSRKQPRTPVARLPPRFVATLMHDASSGLQRSSCAMRRRCSRSIRCSSGLTEAGSPAMSSL